MAPRQPSLNGPLKPRSIPSGGQLNNRCYDEAGICFQSDVWNSPRNRSILWTRSAGSSRPINKARRKRCTNKRRRCLGLPMLKSVEDVGTEVVADDGNHDVDMDDVELHDAAAGRTFGGRDVSGNGSSFDSDPARRGVGRRERPTLTDVHTKSEGEIRRFLDHRMEPGWATSKPSKHEVESLKAATGMKGWVEAVGGWESLLQFRALMRDWREGHLNVNGCRVQPGGRWAERRGQGTRPVIRRLMRAIEQVKLHETGARFNALQLRVAVSEVWRRREAAALELGWQRQEATEFGPREDPSFVLTRPAVHGGVRESDREVRRLRNAYDVMMRKGKAWAKVESELGVGALLLMPFNVFDAKCTDRSLGPARRVDALTLLVKSYNPNGADSCRRVTRLRRQD
ncbi:MAG: hypothetical protein M1831_002268 [Alyxoria varia]|nr:MAG: hypothetical protein M1831_002268 [Alyxoria varia]